MSDLRLAMRQVRYENRAFWRNPAAAVFTFVFPLMFMVIFNVLIGGQYKGLGPAIPASNFFTPTIVAFSLITACYTNVAMGVVFSREAGLLKRIRGTPLPRWVFLFGRIAQSILVALILVVIVTLFGRVFYHVKVPASSLPAIAAAIGVGAATFCALGLAVTGAVPNEDAAPAVVNVTIFPLLFISDVFIPLNNAPKWISSIANIFPVRHLSHALLSAFNPIAAARESSGGDLLVVAVWGVAGIVLAAKFFSWEPRRSS